MFSPKRLAAALASLALAASAAFAPAGALPPQFNADHVDAYGTDRYTITFEGGEPARILVKGDGDTHLVLSVYDQGGHLIARDDDNDSSGVCLAQWTPAWTGPFTVRITNTGSVYNNYVLRTN
jgi:hypothetical protein